MSRRTERVGNVIQREIGSFILRELSDPRLGFLTVSRADVSPDLGNVRVTVSVMGGDAEKQSALAALSRQAPRMRAHLAKALRTRKVPRVSFELDRNLDHGFRIAELLKDLDRGEEP